VAVTIRAATVHDSFVVADVKSEAWRASFRAFIPEQALNAATAEEVHRHWLGVPKEQLPDCGLLLRGHDEVIGYALFGAARLMDTAASYMKSMFGHRSSAADMAG
jgi:hypothetical protein